MLRSDPVTPNYAQTLPNDDFFPASANNNQDVKALGQRLGGRIPVDVGFWFWRCF